MKTHKFTGATSREVLQKVKQALGEDALILSNRARDGEIEVVALAAADLASAAAAPVSEAAPIAEPPRTAAPRAVVFPRVDEPAVVRTRPAPMEEERAAARPLAQAEPADERVELSSRYRMHAASERPLAPAPAPALAPKAPELDGILSEIQSLKSILRNDIAAFAAMEAQNGASGSSGVLRDLLNAGFSAKLARELAGETKTPGAQPRTMEEVAQRLEATLRVAEEDEIIRRGGIYALVGPTGVGKTTTVAKLAARAVVRYGASKVALLTTDSYRIGAHDQLRIYGRILSVPVHAVRDAEELAAVLAHLADRHLILIDTIGMSQRDRMVAEQAAMLAGGGRVQRLLLVSTTANTATLNQVVSAYKSSGVHGCILTKTDEAASLAPALDAVIRHELPVHYVTDGQRVPEDLQLPNAAALVAEALRPLDDESALAAEDAALLTQPASPAPASAPAPAVHLAPAVPAEPLVAAEPAVPMHAVAPVRAFPAQVVHG